MHKVLRRAGTVLSAVALTAAITVALATIVIPKLMGATPYTVLSGSMRPALEPGALAIVDPVEPEQIQVGDVITYQLTPGRPEVVTHRVMAIHARSDGERSFVTQGDANTTPDTEPVLPVQVRGQVVCTVPWMGYVNSAINTDTRSTVVVVAAVALIVYGLVTIGSAVVTRRRGVPATGMVS